MTDLSRKLLLAAAATAAAVAAMLPATSASAQDFDCKTASLAAEKTICEHRRLTRLDDRMAELYGRLWAKLDDDNREGLRDYQRMFLETRNACRQDVACIEGAYQDQIGVLKARLENRRFAHR
jgi:uncharacterized protein